MWRFVQITDPHLGSQSDGQWNNRFLCSMMPDVMRCLKRDLAGLQPEFILATGDLASQQTRDAMFAARDLMDSLGFPYYPMGGNHDFVSEKTRAWFIEAFHAHLPIKRSYYSFTHKNLHFCLLDPWWVWADGTISPESEKSVAATINKGLKGARWAVPQDQLDWLAEDLAQNKDRITVIASHYPAVPIPDRLRTPGLRDGGSLENGPELIGLLNRHPQVKAIFSGHVHLHFIEQIDGLMHVCTGALPEYPSEYRDIHVHDDRMEIFTNGLSDSSFATRSLIPGKEWAAGEECDRAATIRFS